MYAIHSDKNLVAYPSNSDGMVPNYEPLVISEADLREKCSQDGNIQNKHYVTKCYLYIRVLAMINTRLSLYAEKNSSNVLLFPNQA